MYISGGNGALSSSANCAMCVFIDGEERREREMRDD
jgi:hypothetical protein